MNIAVTGGCGFIGSNLIELLLGKKDVDRVVNIDSLTYAGSHRNVKDILEYENYYFERCDIRDTAAVIDVFNRHNIEYVFHLAAESHVDNSINNPFPFVQSNVVGTMSLLEASRRKGIKKFINVSTDEVYGELGKEGKFTEDSIVNPSSPYSATKSSADLIVSSYVKTYKFPAITTRCSNNYGPKQHKEKFIPVVINSVYQDEKIPVYGTGKNIRDWIYVGDHCRALWKVFTDGNDGEVYNIGSNAEKSNLQIIQQICRLMKVRPKDHIEHVGDRLGHDFRYAIDNSKITKLGWKPMFTISQGMKKTVNWYIESF
jgi:dTDP-glucose 4,6-dehydratase